mmetsp:Transcript_21297/g.81284  ORF Transcript_21297/g.81284 Transcript_21297/m.81284 type:complete len:205 (-) Transcript_21297:282-896(-)
MRGCAILCGPLPSPGSSPRRGRRLSQRQQQSPAASTGPAPSPPGFAFAVSSALPHWMPTRRFPAAFWRDSRLQCRTGPPKMGSLRAWPLEREPRPLCPCRRQRLSRLAGRPPPHAARRRAQRERRASEAHGGQWRRWWLPMCASRLRPGPKTHGRSASTSRGAGSASARVTCAASSRETPVRRPMPSSGGSPPAWVSGGVRSWR